jgi:hypothetical protein
MRLLLRVTIVLALGTAACGASSTSTATTASPSGSSTTATSGGGAASPGQCQGGHLSAEVADAGDGAAATRYLTIHVTNTGSSSCVTGGYFTVSSLGINGQVISVQNDHVASSSAHLTLPPGAALSFTIGIDDLPSGPQGSCPRAAALQLRAPGDSSLIHLALLDAQGEGTQVVECPGPISVSPATAA